MKAKLPKMNTWDQLFRVKGDADLRTGNVSYLPREVRGRFRPATEDEMIAFRLTGGDILDSEVIIIETESSTAYVASRMDVEPCVFLYRVRLTGPAGIARAYVWAGTDSREFARALADHLQYAIGMQFRDAHRLTRDEFDEYRRKKVDLLEGKEGR